MAREKTGGRKPAIINPLNEDLARAGDGHGLVRAMFDAGEPTPLDPPAGPGAGTDAISLTAGSLTYTQTFDTLASTGTTGTALPTDWIFNETGGAAPTTYSVGTGSSTTGDTWSYGVAGTNPVTDRAFGSLASGTVTQILIGSSFANNSGGTITSLLISYFGEQWRRGGNTLADRLDFQISFNATSLTTGTWTDVNGLDFVSINGSGSALTLDGNATANRLAISFNITGLSVANGGTFWIRWIDTNIGGNDDGLAIDNFSLTATVNQAPTIGALDGDLVSWTEDVSGPAILDADALLNVTDADSADFSGGTLTVSVSANGVAGEDVLSLANQPGSIELSGGNVLHNGVAIGTWTGGANGAALLFTFNAAATPLGVTALMRNLTYDNVSQDPVISQREIQYVLTDGDGGTRTVHSLVSINATDDDPVIGNLDGDSVSWQFGDDPVRIDLGGDATVTDVDSPQFPDFLLQVSSSHGDEDAIGIAEIGGVTVVGTDVLVDLVDIGDILFDGSEGLLQIQLSGLATADYVQRVLQAVTFANANGTPTVGAHTMSVALFDPVSSVGGYAETIVDVVGGTLSVGNLVFLDANHDGVFDAGDSGLDGITVALRDGGGGLVATTVTGGGGLYSFTGLFAGDYYLLIDAAALPPGLISVPTATDPDDDVDNDNNGVFGPMIGTAFFTLTAGGEPDIAVDGNGANANFTVDFGFVYTPPTIDLDLSGGGTGFATSYTEGGSGVPTVDIDVDIVSAGPVDSVTITLTDFQDGDELFLSGLPSGEDIIVSAYDDGTGTIIVYRNGATLAELEEALRHIHYRNTGINPTVDGADAERTIAFVANAGAGPSNTAVATIAITAVNTPATIGGTATGTILEDTTIGTGGQLTISDPDGPDSFAAFGPVAGSGGYGNFSLGESGAWTYEADNALIQFLGAGVTAADAIDAVAADGTVQALTVTITGVNDAAAIDGDDTGAVTEDGLTSTSGTLDVDDVDTGESSFEEQTAAATAYGTFSIDAAGHWSYQLDNMNAAVQALDTGDSMTDTIEVRAFDGTSHDVVITINGVDEPVAAPPVVDLDGGAAGIHHNGSFTEGGTTGIGDAIQVIQGTFPITSATIILTDGLAGDSLSIVGTLPLGITNISGNDQQIQLVGIGISAAQWAAALGQIAFTSSSDNPDAYGTDAARTINVELSDGFTIGATAIATIAIVAVNDAPVVTIPAGTTAYAESVNAAPGSIAVNNALTVTDVDDTSLLGATVSISNNFQAGQDILAFTNDNAATFGNIAAVYDTGSGVLTLASAGGSATLAQWQAALRAVAYSNSSEEPSQLTRTISFTVNDGDAGSAAATRLLSVTAQNDSPSGANGTATIDEDAIFTFTAAHFGFTDVDGDAFAGVRFGAAPAGGTLYFDADGAGGNAPVAITSFPTTTYNAADIAAGRLTFVPTANLNGAGAASVSFSVVDNGGTVGAGQNTDLTPNTLTFDIASVNDQPSGTDKTITIDEDAAYTLTVADFGFSDVDGNGFEAVIFSNTVAGGTLYINGNPMTNVTLVYLHTIQSGNVVFVPAADATGAVGSIRFTVRDDGGFANGGQAADTTPNFLTFSMTPVNDAPVNGVPGAQNVDEDASLVFSTANGNALSVADVDAATLTVTLSVANGTLTLASNVGLTFLDSGGDAAMTFSGTAAAINMALGAGLTYAPAADYHGGDTLSITTSDGGQAGAGGTRTDADSVAITVDPVADTPVIANFDADVTFIEGSAPIRIDIAGDALVTDVDTMDFAGGYLQVLLEEAVPSEDVIGFATAPDTGITLSDGTHTGSIVSIGGIAIGTIVSGSPTPNSFTVNFNANADAADVTALLRAITYLNTNNDHPSTLTRAIVVFVNDGDGGGQAGAVSNVHVTRVNDAPVNTVPGGQTVAEDASLTLSTANGNAIGVADVDATTLTVTLSVAHGTLTIASTAGLTFSDSAGDASMTFSGTAAAINAALGAGLTYVPTANFNGSDAISVITTDGGQTGTGPVGTDGDSINININSVNDAPSGTSATITLNEDGTRILTQADFGFSDPVEGHGFAGVAITTLPTNGTLLLNGAGLLLAETFVSAAQLAAGQLVFQPDANENGAAYATLTFQVRDDGGTGNGGQDTDPSPDTLTFNVTAVNDAPAGTSGTIVINEDNGRVLTAADFGFSDTADGDAFAGVVLTSLPTAGFLIYDPDGAGGLPGVFVNVGRFITAAELALGALTYFPPSNANGAASASFTFQVRDGGGTANGGQDTDQSPNTITFDINPVNDAPSGAGATITISEDSSRILTEADFGFSDPVEGHGFAGVVIATLPGAGALLLNGVAIAGAGTFVSAAQLSAGQLAFAPGLNGNGAGYASFDFQVRDAGGTANGGQDTDQSPNSLTFNVTALNDAPALDLNGAGAGLNNSASYVENAAPTLLAPAAVLGDVDSPDFDGGSVHAEVVTNVQPSDFLQIVNQGAGAGQIGVSGSAISYEGVQFGNLQQAGASNLTILLNSNATAAAVQALIRALSYFAPTEAPGGGTRSILVSVADGDGGTTSRTVSLAVTPVNDAPSGTDNHITGSEDDPYVFTAADFGFSDPGEGHDFFAVRITTLPIAGDILLNGTAVTAGDFIAVSAIEAGMLTFQPDPDAAGAPYASFTFQVQDSGGTANGGQDVDQTPNTITIAITPDNLAPALDLDAGTAGVDAALIYTENDPATAIAPAATLTDDSPDFAGGTITAHFAANGAAGDRLSLQSGNGIAVSPTDDTLFYDGVLIGSWGGGIGGADLIVQLNASASAAAVQAVLRAIAYANPSDNPSVPARTIAVEVADGDGGTASAQVIVSLVAVDDAAVARDDGFTLDEAGSLSGSVFADHGAGADLDVDGPALSVAAVNGSSAHVGQQILLASGALLTLNGDGSFIYATNHAFDRTPAASSGASNTPAGDRFTYTLAGGGTATVTLVLTGLDTDDTLLGTAGADVLAGGSGNDLYFLDSSADQVIEGAGQGFDTVFSSASYALAAGSEVEVLSAVDWGSTAALGFTGNAGANIVYGNAGANSLDGGGGADVLIGFGGDDAYFVDTAADTVIEGAGQGLDSVFASVSYALAAGAQVEVLSAVDWTATVALSFTGNGLANVVYGNAGANALDGGGGADVLIGFGGDDIYFVDTAADLAIEYAGQGYDTVYAAAGHGLAEGSQIEVLSAINWAATDALDLIGNNLGNNLYGNAGANVLNGGGGADLLTGFGGADIFAFTTALGGGNVDTIADFTAGTDKVALDDAVFTAIGATLGAGAFVIGSAAADADDRIVYNSATGALLYDADGNGAGAAVQFATLTPGLALTASDFQMI